MSGRCRSVGLYCLVSRLEVVFGSLSLLLNQSPHTSNSTTTASIFSLFFPFLPPPLLSSQQYADFGYYNAESLPALSAEALAGGFDFVIHAGDFAVRHVNARGGGLGACLWNACVPR